MLKSVVCMVLAAAWSAAGGDAAPAGAIERAVDDYRRGPGPSNFAAYSAAEALLAREYRRAEGLPPTNGFDDVDNAALLFVHAAGLFPSRTNLAAALICPKRPGRAGDRQNFFLREDEWKARGSNILAMSDSAFVLFNAARLIGAPGAEYPELTNALAAVYRRSEDWSLSRECAAALERHGARPNIADCAADCAGRVARVRFAPRYSRGCLEARSAVGMAYDLGCLPANARKNLWATNVLELCFVAKASNGLGRACERAMRKYDPAAAARFRREEVNDPFLDFACRMRTGVPEMDGMNRLGIAGELARAGDPYGYPAVREALLWRHVWNSYSFYDEAASQLPLFAPLDGQPVGGSGARVDLRALLAESAATNDLYAAQVRSESYKNYLSWQRGKSDAETRIGLADRLGNKQKQLWARAYLAGLFAKEKGWLAGWPAAREAALSRDPYTRRRGMEALQSFRPYDGKPWDGGTNLVDVGAVLRDSAAAPAYFDRP